MSALPEAIIQEAERLAEKVAALGAPDGLDAVVTVLRDHLERLDRERRIALSKAVSAEFRAALIDPTLTREQIDEEMYDEHGLPR